MGSIIEDHMVYYEKLLCLQFHASESFEHRLTKGEIRKKFITDFFMNILGSDTFRSGILANPENSWQSPQTDFIKPEPDSTLHASLYDVRDSLIFMEIKSNAQSSEFDHLNKISKKMKHYNDKLKTGIFCYKTRAEEATIVSKFGLIYDKSLDGYAPYQIGKDLYPNIDFCFSLDIGDENDINTSCYFLDESI